MSNSLFTIALMIGYIGAARAFNWSSESLWGLVFLFATALFLILREAFPNRFGVLNARLNVIHSLQQTIKRKNYEIEVLKSTLRESHDELRGIYALWMNSKSDTNTVRSQIKKAEREKTIETILATENWNLLASNAELSDEERMEIASNIIQKVLPADHFRSQSIIEDIKEEESLAQMQFVETSSEETLAVEQTAVAQEIPVAHFEEVSVAKVEETSKQPSEKQPRHFEAYDFAYEFNSVQ